MSNEMLLIFLIGSFLILTILKVPVAFSLALSSLVTLLLIDKGPVLLVQRMYASLEYYPLLAIPFFTLVGVLMSSGTSMDRILEISRAFIGHMKGSLAQINILVSMLFAGVSGTSTSDTAGIGGILIPAMKRSGYPAPFTVAVTAASSTIGTIIPPSVLMIVFGSTANVSVSKLFLGGAIPGILVGVIQMIYSYVLAKKYNWPSNSRVPWREKLLALLRGIPPMMVPVIIIAGILLGIFTATEAGCIAAVYAVLLGIFYREINLRNFSEILTKAAKTLALPLFCIATSTVFGWLLAYLDAPSMISGWVLSFTSSKAIGLICIFAMFFVVGMFIDGVPAIIIFAPVAVAIADALGISLIQVGIVCCMTASLGLITPPFGLCLLMAAKLGEVEIIPAIKATIPFVALFSLTILLVILIPPLCTLLPQLVA